MKFALQTKVVEKKHLRAHYSYHPGVVIAITPDNHYVVEQFGHCHKSSEEELLSEDEATAEMIRLEAVQSQLDADFEAVREQFQDKITQAATLLKEAAALAEACKKDIYSLRQECRPLALAFKDAGWRVSSLAC